MKISEITTITGKKKRIARDPRNRRHISNDELHTVEPTDLDEQIISESRIQHVEDLILWDGAAGAINGINALRSVVSSPDDVTIKWDGSPAVMFGRNENGEFVLTDKSGFTAKGYDGRVTSGEDLENMFLNRGKGEIDDSRRAFAATMKSIWPIVESSVPSEFRGYVLGDLLYFTTPPVTDGRFEFTPNTTTYSVDVSSEVGKDIGNSTTGVVLHAHTALDGTTGPVDANAFNIGKLLIMPPKSISHAPEIDDAALNELEAFINKRKPEIDKVFDQQVLTDLKMKDFSNIVYTYINNRTKEGTLDSLGTEDFLSWAVGSKLSGPKKTRLDQYIVDNSVGFDTVLTVIIAIMKIKNNIISALDDQPADIEAHTAGQRGGEGYVIGKDSKLVNRSAFTQANMARMR